MRVLLLLIRRVLEQHMWYIRFHQEFRWLHLFLVGNALNMKSQLFTYIIIYTTVIRQIETIGKKERRVQIKGPQAPESSSIMFLTFLFLCSPLLHLISWRDAMAPDMAGRGFGQHCRLSIQLLEYPIPPPPRQKKPRVQWIPGFPRSALPLATGSGSSQTVALLG